MAGVLVAVMLLGLAARAHASELWYYGYYGEKGTCWQTGHIGAESLGCDSVGSGFLKVPGRTPNVTTSGIGEDIGRTPNGDYCSSYVGDALTNGDGTGEGPQTGFETPTPFENYQASDSSGSVCQANVTSYGQVVRSKSPGCSTHTCGIHHYVSFHELGYTDRPWEKDFGNPELVISTEADIQNLDGTNPSAWGYVCPIFQDTTSQHNMLEYCLQEWRGPGNEATSGDEKIGTCALGPESNNLDTVGTFFYPGTQYATQLSGSANTEVAKAGWRTYKAAITATNLKNAIEQDRKPYKKKAGSREENPELGYGCNRVLSTNPADYALIGVEQGVEGWNAEGSSYSEIGASGANLQVHEQYSPVAPSEVVTGAAIPESGVSKLEGTVNPNGQETYYSYEYGTTSKYGESSGRYYAGSGTSRVAAPGYMNVTGSTEYHYRLVAESPGGTVRGEDKTFTTPGPIITVATPEAEGEQVTLKGTVNPNGESTEAFWELNPAPEYGGGIKAPWPPQEFGSGTTALPLNTTIKNLKPSTNYYYSLLALGAKWTKESPWYKLTTPPAWRVQTLPLPSENKGGAIAGISCISSTSCEAVGWYLNSSNTKLTLAESWNGKEWTVQATPNPSGAKMARFGNVSCVSSTFCVAVGQSESSSGAKFTLAEVWNGKEWVIQTTFTGKGENMLEGISCTSSTACIATGNEEWKPLAESWNGKEWTIQATPNPTKATRVTLRSVSCASSTSCMAVGFAETSSRNDLAESWNGKEWTIVAVTSAPTDSELNSVSCTAASACTAAGNYKKEGATGTAPITERWNGKEWALQTTLAFVENHFVSFGGVACSSSTACTTAGYNIGAEYKTLADRWNGTEWGIEFTTNPTESTGASLSSVSCWSSAAASCMLAGSYKTDPGVTEPIIENNYS